MKRFLEGRDECLRTEEKNVVHDDVVPAVNTFENASATLSSSGNISKNIKTMERADTAWKKYV